MVRREKAMKITKARQDLAAIERVFGCPEVSRLLNITEWRVRQEIKEGRLRASRVGRLYRIRERDVWAYMDASIVAPSAGTR